MKKSFVIKVFSMLLTLAVVSSVHERIVAAEPIIPVTISAQELCAATASYSPFKLSYLADGILGTAGATTTGIVFFMQKKNDFPRWNGTLYDASTVNTFDKWAMNPYNKTLDNVGTATCALDLAVLPLTVFATQSFCGNFLAAEWLTLSTMYVESFLLSYGIKGLMKMSMLWVRPYMYFEGYPDDVFDNSDFEFSWPSGHTTNAFLGAVFTSCVFAWYYPTSSWRIPITCTSLLIAASTGVLRMMSGNHFLTDVLTGAAIGSLCGFIVPFVHHLSAERSGFAGDTSSQKPEVAVTPYGVTVKLFL